MTLTTVEKRRREHVGGVHTEGSVPGVRSDGTPLPLPLRCGQHGGEELGRVQADRRRSVPGVSAAGGGRLPPGYLGTQNS